MMIQLRDGGGRGSHSTLTMYVDNRLWATIDYYGTRSGWRCCDSQGHTLFFASSKADAAQRMQTAFDAGEIPDPDKAWRNSVEGAIAVGASPLLESVQEFVALARDNPALAGSNSFRRMVDEAVAIYRAPLKKFQENVQHAAEWLDRSERQINDPYTGVLGRPLTGAELERAKEARQQMLLRDRRRAEDAHARLAYAEAQIKVKLIRLGLIGEKPT